jgi:hypothetical protein
MFKIFDQFKTDLTAGRKSSFTLLVTLHEWRGRPCVISSRRQTEQDAFDERLPHQARHLY